MRKFFATPRSVLTGLGPMLVALLVFSAPALALRPRLYTGVSFGPQGTGAETFSEVQSVAVDQTSGDVFVYDGGEGGRIYKFDAAGEPVDFSGLGTNAITNVGAAGNGEGQIAIDDSGGPASGDIYVAESSQVRIYSSAGVPLGALSGGEMCGVAVDASGTVYVGVYSSNAVRKYVPTANPVTNQNEVSSMGDVIEVCNLAVDSAGNVYAASYAGGVTRYEASQFGSLVATGTLIDGAGRTLAVDQLRDTLFVNENDTGAEYQADGELVGQFGGGQIQGSFGVGISDPKNELYLPSEGRVMVFGPPLPTPTVSGEIASEITNSSATVSGGINPEGAATTYQFQYGTTTSYGFVAPASPQNIGSDSTTHEVNTHLTGLSLDTEYHYRLVATNSSGTSYGPDRTFETAGPPTVFSQSASKETQTSSIVGGYIEPHGLDTHYRVEYGTSESYGSITPEVDKGVQAGNATKELTGLRLDTVYHYRFVVTNADGTAYSLDRTFSTTPAVRIESESVSGAANSEATLKAIVDDFGAQSTYYFEYGPTSSYGATTPDEALSSEAQIMLSGLPSETTYHFRVVVKNQFGMIDGEDAIFATAPPPSLILPDARRYEKVSPNANANGNVVPPAPVNLSSSGGNDTELPFMAADDGSSFVYVGEPPEIGGTGKEGAQADNQYLSRRSPTGNWTTEDIAPASGEISDTPLYQAFTNNLSAGFMTSNGVYPLTAGAPGEHFSVLYTRTSSNGVFEPLFSIKPPDRSYEEFIAAGVSDNGINKGPVYAGSSTDLSNVLFIANDALTANAIDGGRYENNLYDSHNGTVTLVNVLPDGTTEPNATFGGTRLASDAEYGNGPSFSHDISEDGRRIFWTDLNNHNLYLREGGTRTVQVDAGAGGGGMFWTATPDGSKALFMKSGDIYEYDLEDEQTTNLTHGAEVQGIVGTSEDLSYVYFVADAALTPDADHQECKPFQGFYVEGQCNLYVLHQGEPVRFIAKLSPKDNYSTIQSFGGPEDGDWQSGMGNREAEVTPDGRHLVFGSEEPLTGYNSHHAEEVFTYDFVSGLIFCASCNPTGELPLHNHLSSSQSVYSAFLPVSHINTYTQRWMSSDGTKVFFDSADPLVPQDTDGVVDVYEWEADGVGSCLRLQGCIYLLSAGSSPESSWLLDASENGEDVFIATRSQLTAEDQNETIDAYDVRANAPMPPAQLECSGTGCQGIPSSPPVFATPSSVTYNGVGNFLAQPSGTTATKSHKVKKKQEKHRKKIRKKRETARHKANKSARKSVESHGRSK